MSKKLKKQLFTLLGVNIDQAEIKYGLRNEQSLSDTTVPINATKIEELEVVKKTPDVLSFLDESRKIRKCILSSINFQEKKRYKCFWCKNSIPESVIPIGCPIKYVASRAIKTYNSEISKEKYTISEAITEKKSKLLKNSLDKRFSLDEKGYYETDGIFCSFNCCMAFIQDSSTKQNSLYKNSETLLLQMYVETHPEEENLEEIEIIPAPHWRLLSEFGGNLDIKKFRESFNRILYTDHGIVTTRSIGLLFEDQIKF